MKTRIRLMAFIGLGFLVLAAQCQAAAPENDNLSSATILSGTNLVLASSNLEASKEVGEPDHAGNPGGRSVWWKWAAPGPGSLILQTAGSSFDTLLAVYSGLAFSGLSLLASNDDAGSTSTSTLGLNVTRGTVYAIAVDGFSGAAGAIRLHLEYRSTPLERPPNDGFAQRRPLTGDALSVAGSNFFASKETNEPAHASELGGASLWWSWTAPRTGLAVVGTRGSTVDTLLAVYTGVSLSNLVLVASNDDFEPETTFSEVRFSAQADTEYQIAVDSYNGDLGDIKLQITLQEGFSLEANRFPPLGGVTLRLRGSTGTNYVLEGSSDFSRWSNLTNGAGGISYFEPVTGQPYRFYRGRQLP